MSYLPTAADLALYFEGRKFSPVYDRARTMYESLRVHANGEKPGQLIETRRPNESDEVQQYRLQIYEPVTKSIMTAVLLSLGKIRRSRDWMIKYKHLDEFRLIPPDENLEEYCEHRFPSHTSVTNWLFSVYLKSMLIDANCAVLVLPTNPHDSSDKYKKPSPIVFYADQIIEYVEDGFAIFKSREKVMVSPPNPPRRGGLSSPPSPLSEGEGEKLAPSPSERAGGEDTISDKYYVVTPTQFVPYVKYGDAWVQVAEEIVIHNLGRLPVLRPRPVSGLGAGAANL